MTMNDLTLADLRQRSVVTDSGCWSWNGGLQGAGYGEVYNLGRKVRVHRLAWELANGTIPVGLCVMHTCDNRPCCNPDHLRIGTAYENTADMIAKGRKADNRGQANPYAKLTTEQVREIRASSDPRAVIAARYGIGRSTVTKIRSGQTWRSVA